MALIAWNSTAVNQCNGHNFSELKITEFVVDFFEYMAVELPSPVREDKNKLHSTSGRTSVSQGKSQCWVIQWGKPSDVEILVFMMLLIDRNKCKDDDAVSGSSWCLSLVFTKQNEIR